MLKKFPLRKWLILTVGCLFLLILPPWLYILITTHSRIFHISDSFTPAPVAIVFGAGLYSNGSPTPYLADRVRTAVQLYRNGAIQKIVMSGDNRFPDYNEPEAMKSLAVSLGVKEADILLDFAGRRTYDSCYRARFVFDIRKTILVSQDYHLPRAVYTCQQLGIEAIGVGVDQRDYNPLRLAWYTLREVFACDTALIDIHLLHTQPVLGPLETLG